MSDWRKRLPYLACAVAVMALGLASRRYGAELPDFVAKYAGDTLWALMVFLGVSVLVPRTSVALRGGLAISFAFAIELSQLYHAPWIDSIRRTTLGGLVVGFEFVWTDVVCYASGIAFGAVIDFLVVSRTPSSELD